MFRCWSTFCFPHSVKCFFIVVLLGQLELVSMAESGSPHNSSTRIVLDASYTISTPGEVPVPVSLPRISPTEPPSAAALPSPLSHVGLSRKSPSGGSTRRLSSSVTLKSYRDIEPESFPYDIQNRSKPPRAVNLVGKDRQEESSKSLCNLSLEILYLRDPDPMPLLLRRMTSHLNLVFSNETYFRIDSLKDAPINDIIKAAGARCVFSSNHYYPYTGGPPSLLSGTRQPSGQADVPNEILFPSSTQTTPEQLRHQDSVAAQDRSVTSSAASLDALPSLSTILGDPAYTFFSAPGRLSKEGNAILRLLLLSTDSFPLQDPSTASSLSREFESFDSFGASSFDAGLDYLMKRRNQCSVAGYSSLHQLEEMLKLHEIHLGFLSLPLFEVSETKSSNASAHEKKTAFSAHRVWKRDSTARLLSTAATTRRQGEVSNVVTPIDRRLEEVGIVDATSDAVQRWGEEACVKALSSTAAVKEKTATATTISDQSMTENVDPNVTKNLRPENQLDDRIGNITGDLGVLIFTTPDVAALETRSALKSTPGTKESTTTTTRTTTMAAANTTTRSPFGAWILAKRLDLRSPMLTWYGIVAVGVASAVVAALLLGIGSLLHTTEPDRPYLPGGDSGPTHTIVSATSRDVSQPITPSLYA